MRRPSLIILPILLGCVAAFTFTSSNMFAAVFDGGGIFSGLGAASGISGIAKGDAYSTANAILIKVLTYLFITAVIVVCIAGIYLIIGMGSDESKETAKKIIMYTLIGLFIIFMARVIVGIVAVEIPSAV